MNQYGVCNCDLTEPNIKITDLRVYNNYEDAFASYLDEIMIYSRNHADLPKSLYIVFIDTEKNRIEQFYQLTNNTIVKLVPLPKTT